VTDAVTDTSERAHLNSLEVIFPQAAELATTHDVLTAIDNGHRPAETQHQKGATGTVADPGGLESEPGIPGGI
jgi:hypothetical protein